MEILTALLLVIVIVLLSILIKKVESLSAKMDLLANKAGTKKQTETPKATAEKPGQGTTNPPTE